MSRQLMLTCLFSIIFSSGTPDAVCKLKRVYQILVFIKITTIPQDGSLQNMDTTMCDVYMHFGEGGGLLTVYSGTCFYLTLFEYLKILKSFLRYLAVYVSRLSALVEIYWQIKHFNTSIHLLVHTNELFSSVVCLQEYHCFPISF